MLTGWALNKCARLKNNCLIFIWKLKQQWGSLYIAPRETAWLINAFLLCIDLVMIG